MTITKFTHHLPSTEKQLKALTHRRKLQQWLKHYWKIFFKQEHIKRR